MKLTEHVTKYLYRYLNSRFVFLMDLVLSVGASILAVLVHDFITQDVVATKFSMMMTIIFSFFATVISMLVFRTYSIIVRHSSFRDMVVYVSATVLKVILMFVAALVIRNTGVLIGQVIVIDFFLTLFFVLSVRVAMIVVYGYVNRRSQDLSSKQRILVWGTSEKAAAVITRLANSTHYRVVGLISENPDEAHLKLQDVPIYVPESEEDLAKLINTLAVRDILFTSEDNLLDNKKVVEFAANNGIKTLLTPTIDESNGGVVMKNRIREVRIEDLLGRPEIKISLAEIKRNFGGKTVMVTGAAGSIGSELCRQLARFGIKKLILFDNAETPMHNLRLELEERFPKLSFVPVIGSVRHLERLDYAFRTYEPQIVFHAAAYKHVPLMEENPCEAVLDNLCGTRHVADKCVEYGVEKMVMVSTDKAVNPTNIMGASKRLAEIYVQSLGLAIERGRHEGVTKFITTRFGNVLGSNGSVIPRFRDQIAAGGPVTVTDPEMTRYFMTIPEACRLVMEAATISRGNEICVFDMGKRVKIVDLATKMIQLAGLRPGKDIEIVFTGLRPGEKLYEEVLATEENTLPTAHKRIRIAQVREYDYADALSYCEQLYGYATKVEIPEMVMLMKKVVPEFVSNNSKFEKYDK